MSSEEFEKAKELLTRDKIARINPDDPTCEGMFVVTGKHDDYLVILPNYCTCTHFHITCVKEKDKVCKHIIASRMVGENVRTINKVDWQDLIFRFR